jgi:branched-chain amino acid aminotransferase
VKIPYLELPHFTEILAAGTAAMVVPIKSITRKSTGDVFTYSADGPGEACQRLAKALSAVQKGLATDDRNWLWPVAQVADAEE